MPEQHQEGIDPDTAEAAGMTDAAESSAPTVADETLLEAHDLARSALLEITTESSVGAVAGHVVEGDHVLSLLFECTLLGYPGWHWTVTLARVDDGADPVVLEAELLPGAEALLAPDWVPWSERLAEYQAAQEAARAAGAEASDDDERAESADDRSGADLEDGDELDDDDDEFAEDDEFDRDDDIDGIDIDVIDPDDQAADEESADEESADDLSESGGEDVTTDDVEEDDESDDGDDESGEDDIDVEADDIIGAESAALVPGSDDTIGGSPASASRDGGVDEPDDAQRDADDRGGDHPAES